MGVVQKGGGLPEIPQAFGGDSRKRNIEKMLSGKDEMEVERLTAAEDDGKAPILGNSP
jgi:hypothetical protein